MECLGGVFLVQSELSKTRERVDLNRWVCVGVQCNLGARYLLF